MKRLFTLILGIAFLTSCDPGSSTEAEIKAVETSLSSIVHITGDSLWTIEDRMKHYGVPGVSIAVIKDYKIVWVKSYGIIDKETNEPVTGKTLFQAGSISKPVAAYGALKFVQDGKLDAETDVNAYLKSWKLPDSEFTKDKKVHLKHLVSHSGGITVHGFPGYSPDQQVPTLVQVLDGMAPANTAAIRVDKVPGESWRYSGGGYTIMQQMLIDIDGRSFPEILKASVLDPIGMSNSTYEQPLPPGKIEFAATGYLPNHQQTKGKRHTYPEMAAAGLWTTAEDLALWAIDVQLSYQGKSNKVLSKEMTELFLTPYSGESGLGVFIDGPDKKDVYFGHGGWDEGFSSELVAHRDKGYGAVVLTNSNHPAFIEELINGVALAYKWDDYVLEYKSLPMDEASFAGILGRYRYGSDGLVKIYNEGNRLFYDHSAIDPMEMFKITDTTYARREREARIAFMTNQADGTRHLVFITDDKAPVKYEHVMMSDTEKIPTEYFNEGDYAGALKAFEKILAANPKDEDAAEGSLNNRGYRFMEDGKYKEAREMFRINMELYPLSYNVYDSYADACIKLGDRDEAMESLKEALALKPDFAAAKKKLDSLKSAKP